MTGKGLIQENEIQAWVRSMFGTQQGPEIDSVRLVVKVGGRTLTGADANAASDDMRAAIRELTQSFEMHGGMQSPGTEVVAPPSIETIRRALFVLTDGPARRRTLEAALSIFGRRVMAPLEAVLESGETSAAMRIQAWRTSVMEEIEALNLASETTNILRKDLTALLSDDYIAMLDEYEAKTLRPRMSQLAHTVMEILATTFHRTFDRFGGNATQIAERMVRMLPASVQLRDLPVLLKRGFVDCVADYLVIETSSEIEGALSTLSSQFRDVLGDQQPLAFAEDWYRDLALECWRVIALYC